MLGYVAANPAAFGGSSSLRGQRAVSVESRATRSGRGGWSSSAFWGEKPNGMNNFGSVSTPSRDYEVICHLPLGTLEHHHDEERVTVPEAFSDGRKTHLSSVEEYKQKYEQSIQDPQKFWAEVAREFYWKKDFPSQQVSSFNFDVNAGPISVEWFKEDIEKKLGLVCCIVRGLGGQTNICYNALDRQVERGLGDQIAFYYEGNAPDDHHSALTYSEVLEKVCRLANVLKDKGVKKGDCVGIYMPMVPELPIAMLACARIGAVHSVVFGGFSAEALAGRVKDSKNKVLISCDGVMRGKKLIELKKVVDTAVEITSKKGHKVDTVIVLERLGGVKCPVKWNTGRDVWWHETLNLHSTECEPEWMDAEDPLFILYTSGSTGQPKGILHSTGGYMVYAATTFKYAFDYQPSDVYFCTADCGWITGHSYVTYGPMLNGATQVVFEGIPNYPNAGRLWQIVEKYKVSQIYTAPTAIRALMRQGDTWVHNYDRSSLKILGTVGEPINPEAWNWYFSVVGERKCPVVDTWWQTETGGHMLLPLPIPGFQMKPGAASLPFFGCVPVVLDESGNELEGAAEGFLMIKTPWPSTLRSIYGDHKRMENVYFERFPGYYMTGDGCRRDKDGYFWLTGRVDDVLNVSGHRIGTAEVESALVLHPAVAEAAVVGIGHDVKGEEESDNLRKELILAVRKEIGPIATPDVIHWAPSVPKTRSGKIMRRILRKIANGGKEVKIQELGDVSTLADPSVVDVLLKTYGS